MSGKRIDENRPKVTLNTMTIHRFRRVTPDTELQFRPGMNVLIGKNATGKTALLRLISMALRTDFEEVGQEPFELAYELTCGEATVAVEIKNERREVRKGILVRSRKTVWVPSARAVARYRDTGKEATVELREGVVFFKGLGEEDKVRAGGRSPWWDVQCAVQEFLAAGVLDPKQREDQRDDALDAVADDLEETWEDRVRFDEALEFYRLILGEDNEYEDKAECLLPAWRSFLPAGLYREIRKKFGSRGESSLTLTSERLPFLAVAVQVLGFAKARVRAEVVEVDDQNRKRVGNLRFWFDTKDGRVLREDHLSFGQKRMFALVYYLHLNPDVAIVDEPTNGLHHEWIAYLVEQLGKRQTFVATQHPLLLDFLTFESAAEVRSTFVQCRSEPGGEDKKEETWHWSSMTEEDAQRFHDAYVTGVQFVSEILAAKGLW